MELVGKFPTQYQKTIASITIFQPQVSIGNRILMPPIFRVQLLLTLNFPYRSALIGALVSLILAAALIVFLLMWTKKNKNFQRYVPDGLSMSFLSRNEATHESIEGNTKHPLTAFTNKLGPKKNEFSVLNRLDIERHVMPLSTDVGEKYCEGESNLNR